MKPYHQSLVMKSRLKATFWCLPLAECSVLTRPVNAGSLNYMSVSFQKILTEAGFVNSAELGRLRSMNTDASLFWGRSKQELFLLLTPNHPISQGWASRHKVHSHRIHGVDGVGPHGPRQSSGSYNSSLFEELELNGQRDISVKQLGLFPARHPLGTSILRFSGGCSLTEFHRVFK